MSATEIRSRLDLRLKELGILADRVPPDKMDAARAFLAGPGSQVRLHEAIMKLSQEGKSTEAGWLSLLCGAYVLQVPPDRALMGSLFESAVADFEQVEPLLRSKDNSSDCQSGSDTRLLKNWRWSELPPRRSFLRKDHPGAVNKVNVTARGTYAGLLRVDKHLARRFHSDRHLLSLLYEDQVCMLMMYALGMRRWHKRSYEYAWRLMADPVGAKALNSALKSLGQNSVFEGAVLCEAQALQGRGVAPVDMMVEVGKRLKAADNGCVEVASEDCLRAAVRSVIADEFDAHAYEMEDVDAWWSGRWQWCVNGGHARALERHEPKWTVNYKGRVHRKVAAEEWELNPVREWSGNVYVSASEKLEAGKSRLLMACDTVTYMCFDHLLSGVERAWKQRRVVLDPGKGGSVGMARRVRKMCKGSVNVMMDYDAFDTQHTTRAQQIVFEELVKATGYPPIWGARLIASFDKMLCHIGDKVVGYASGMLMTGHRATTFINSVLNAAYIRLHIGDELWNKLDSLHVGDDVLIACNGIEVADRIVPVMMNSKCRLNAVKQSVGMICAEFLRMCVKWEYALGYFARAVASSVSGNWVTDAPMRSIEAVTASVGMCRMLINRSGCSEVIELLVRTLSRRSGVAARKLRLMLKGETAVGDGPVYEGGPVVRRVVLEEETAGVDEKEMEGFPANATVAYLASKVTPVELYAMRELGTSAKWMMLRASYAKSVADPADGVTVQRVRARDTGAARLVGSELDTEVLARPVKTGLLSKYTLLNMYRDRLSAAQVKELLSMIGCPSYGNAEQLAWGSKPRVIRVTGAVPFGDAAEWCRRSLCGVVVVTYNVFM